MKLTEPVGSIGLRSNDGFFVPSSHPPTWGEQRAPNPKQLTAKGSPENRPLESWRFRNWKPPIFRGDLVIVSFRECKLIWRFDSSFFLLTNRSQKSLVLDCHVRCGKVRKWHPNEFLSWRLKMAGNFSYSKIANGSTGLPQTIHFEISHIFNIIYLLPLIHIISL